jgi:WD40 repeat protein
MSGQGRSNLGCRDWCCSWPATGGAHSLDNLCCLLSQWEPHRLCSWDITIRIWDAETGATVGQPLEGHTRSIQSVASSPDGQHVVSGSAEHTSTPIHTEFHSKPHSDGWVRDSQGGLLYWVPPDCRVGLHSPALLTIPRTSRIRSVLLDFEDCAIGTSWAQISKSG